MGYLSMDNLEVTMQYRFSTRGTAWTPSTSAYLSIWPIVFCKDSVIGVHCPISDEHNGLAADASLSSVVELWEEISSNWKTHQRALYIHETSEAWDLGLRKPLKMRAHSASPKRTYRISLSPLTDFRICSEKLELNMNHRREFLKTHTRQEVRF